MPQTNPLINSIARAYHEQNKDRFNLPNWSDQPSLVTVDEDAGRLAGLAFDRLKHAPNDPEVKESYDALKTETLAQYQHAVRHGAKFEQWRQKGQPYPDSKAMSRDLAENHHLWYFPTESGFGTDDAFRDHPLFAEVPGMPGIRYNDLFRAVHDYYAHAKHGHTFGPQGELRAWVEHARMFSPTARRALTTETHGQNSWVNFGPHEPWKLPMPERPYADQKAAVLPTEVYPKVDLARLFSPTSPRRLSSTPRTPVATTPAASTYRLMEETPAPSAPSGKTSTTPIVSPSRAAAAYAATANRTIAAPATPKEGLAEHTKKHLKGSWEDIKSLWKRGFKSNAEAFEKSLRPLFSQQGLEEIKSLWKRKRKLQRGGSTERAFQVQMDPEDQPDDTARLVYADWLDEHNADDAAANLRDWVRTQTALREHGPDTRPEEPGRFVPRWRQLLLVHRIRQAVPYLANQHKNPEERDATWDAAAPLWPALNAAERGALGIDEPEQLIVHQQNLADHVRRHALFHEPWAMEHDPTHSLALATLATLGSINQPRAAAHRTLNAAEEHVDDAEVPSYHRAAAEYLIHGGINQDRPNQLARRGHFRRDYTVRFNLQPGKNFGKWEVIHVPTRAVKYYDPDKVRLRMTGAMLVNRPGLAQKIHSGEIDKTRTAWVAADHVDVEEPQAEAPRPENLVSYNPRRLPFWHGPEGENLDHTEHPVLVTHGTKVARAEPTRLARGERIPGPGAAARAEQTDTHATRLQVARRLLAEAGIDRAIVRSVQAHTDQRGVRPGVSVALAEDVPHALARYLGAWLGLLTGERKVTVFHPGDGEDTLHVIDSPHPVEHVGAYLRAAGLPAFTLEPKGSGSRAFIVNPMDQVDTAAVASGLSATGHNTVQGNAVRIGDPTSDKDARASFRQVIQDAEQFHSGGAG